MGITTVDISNHNELIQKYIHQVVSEVSKPRDLYLESYDRSEIW